jgi:hypothetical protein
MKLLLHPGLSDPESLRGLQRAILPSVLPLAHLRMPVGLHRFEPVQ